jgi:phosphopantetheinyl transferase (holo-ACP synthase)
MVPSNLPIPAGCSCFDEVLAPGDDAHAAGRRLAARALAVHGDTLAYDGTRPIASHTRISIAHSKTRVVAIAGPVTRLGIDIVDDADRDRIAQLAPRFFGAADRAVERFAATEAALKALGRGLLDGGVFDRPVTVSFDPPRVTVEDDMLALVLGRLGDSIVAIAYQAGVTAP